MLTKSSDIQVWNRSTKQNKEQATTKNNKRGISRNEAKDVSCTCHANRAGGAPSAAPATQNEAAPKAINRRRTSAEVYEVEGALSAAPDTQNEPEAAPSAAMLSWWC